MWYFYENIRNWFGLPYDSDCLHKLYINLHSVGLVSFTEKRILWFRWWWDVAGIMPILPLNNIRHIHVYNLRLQYRFILDSFCCNILTVLHVMQRTLFFSCQNIKINICCHTQTCLQKYSFYIITWMCIIERIVD